MKTNYKYRKIYLLIEQIINAETIRAKVQPPTIAVMMANSSQSLSLGNWYALPAFKIEQRIMIMERFVGKKGNQPL